MKQNLRRISLYKSIQRKYREARYQWMELFHRASARWGWQSGVTKDRRNTELVVSLTTIPERITKVHICIETLLRQTLKPDRLILWLSESIESGRDPIRMDLLPASLTRLQNRGLEIRWCDDIRSYRKFVPTVRAFPDALVVTVDDDHFYPRHLLEDLFDAYIREPQYIHCHRARLMRYDASNKPARYRDWELIEDTDQGPSFDVFPTSGGGVLYAPGHLDPEVLNEHMFRELCPTADDVWYKAMSVLANVRCKKVLKRTTKFHRMRIPNNRTLAEVNFPKRQTYGEPDGNDRQIRAVGERYGIFGF